MVIARLQTAGVICLESFKDFPQMARFTLRDEGIIIPYRIGPFFSSRETIFADFGIILKNKHRELHGGYGQWLDKIGNL